MSDLFQCVWHELSRRRIRTLINILGYTLAVGLMVVITCTLMQTGQAAGKILDHTGTHFVAFMPMDRSMCPPCLAQWSRQRTVEGFTAFGIETTVIPRDFIGKVQTLETVAHAAPFLQYRFHDPNSEHMFTIGGFNPADAAVVGTTSCADGDIIEGRFLTGQDHGRIMLEQAYATLLQVSAGRTLTICGQTFDVIGIVNPGIRPAKADVYMLFEDAESLIAKYMGDLAVEDPINMILVEVTRAGVQDQALRDIKQLWPDLIVSSYACYKPASQALAVNHTMAVGLGVVVCIAVVLLSGKSQMAGVVERHREIGILKTIGWRNSIIARQILTESLVQALAGACLGNLLGFGVFFFVPVEPFRASAASLEFSTILWIVMGGVLLTVLGGTIAGLVPAMTVTRCYPSHLLRRI